MKKTLLVLALPALLLTGCNKKTVDEGPIF